MLVLVTLILIAAAISVSIFQTENEEVVGLSVVASFYPLAYFSEQVGGELVTVRSLIPYNTEVHAWQPKPSDIIAAKECDIFVYNGAGLEPWVEDDIIPILDTSTIVVECTHGLELLEGGHGDHDHEGADPHTWLDPVMAKFEAEAILEALIAADPGNESEYQANADTLFSRFAALDDAFTTGLADMHTDLIIVTHEAYGYLAHRYGFGLEAVVGISAEEQPSAAVLANLVDTVAEHDIEILYTDPVYASEYADTLKALIEQQSDVTVEIVPLYLMTGPFDGLDYFDQQEMNLVNLKKGLVD